VTINHLPDEVILEMFDFYRQGIEPYDHHWKEKYAWLNLAHVCRNWRAVVFASSSRLGLSITVGPEKPGHIKTILSGPLPILIDYKCMYRDITNSALWRMRSALHIRDRVHGISFEGTKANFDKFFKVTNCAFPELESLVLQFIYGDEPRLPDTFLRGPDLSELSLRRLLLSDVSLASITGFLLSATALTDLSLLIDTAFGPSPETSLLACFQGMPFLRSLNLYISSSPSDSDSPSQASTPKFIVPLSTLTFFSYIGHSKFLEDLVAGISAPSLREVNIECIDAVWPTTVHLRRFINEIEEYYHTIYVAFLKWDFHLSLLTQLEHIGHCKPCIDLGPVRRDSPESIILMSGVLSTGLATVEELHVTFDKTDVDVWEGFIPWGRFLKQLPGVKALRTKGASSSCIARILQEQEKHGDLAFLPALEEIDLGEAPSHESESGSLQEIFRPFISSRKQAGRPVKVFFI
jgi:hypothetical protein